MLAVNVAGLFTLTRELMPMLIAAGTQDHPASVRQHRLRDGHDHAIREFLFLFRVKGGGTSFDPHSRERVCGEEQVTVNAIAPGPFPTNMTKFAIGDEAGQSRAAKAVPMHRVGRPDDMAGTLLFLTGRAGGYTPAARSCRSTAA